MAHGSMARPQPLENCVRPNDTPRSLASMTDELLQALCKVHGRLCTIDGALLSEPAVAGKADNSPVGLWHSLEECIAVASALAETTECIARKIGV